ncbi:hypothetical protein ASPACDRAFT_1859591 [Aspergillus aculeatus ATCC 16872]|uniref:Uncharacterized protein n=1 Tax=Aspergillus aculeatus (strain ATCC 16872 / CBS 172.66 / WB 5094) TaxID=690307 RepID=A0A1L9WJN5_ASPA1|nr:uncharacterized protein ASPACDRAFT_1859591 [Aspergillus aculeatus ATCC 16872]OJJ96376.1 hypothetical protein ASPACDRAFT_1859591 [Aspergillus aculeatus ATCC 16872]
MTTIDPCKPSLTSNDSAVLQALFDAESSPSSALAIDATLPTLPAHLNISPEKHESLKSAELEIIRTLQQPEPSLSTVQKAITDLDLLITDAPTYPSAYMNRAQARRLLIDLTLIPSSSSLPSSSIQDPDTDTDTDLKLFAPANRAPASALLADLTQAIQLASPRSPADPVSPGQARILADAYTHRGYLLLKAARFRHSHGEGGPERLDGLGAQQLEEMASGDFFLGGRFGNKVAQQLAVQTNPYAKMCGAIVKEALRKEVAAGSVMDW